MPAHTMSHFTILTRDVAATEAFYRDMLGFTSGYRPPISRPGVWLYAGKEPILHVIDPVNMPQQPAGVLDHMAFNATGLKETAAKLKQRGINYMLQQQGETGTWQLFFLDVNGAKVELNYEKDEPGAHELRNIAADGEAHVRKG
jgi:catechol 2,3-dioxygenase-like lactoylglutathione lyase family enzyme